MTDKPFYKSKKWMAVAMVCLTFLIALCVKIPLAKHGSDVPDLALTTLAGAIAAGISLMQYGQGKEDTERAKQKATRRSKTA